MMVTILDCVPFIMSKSAQNNMQDIFLSAGNFFHEKWISIHANITV